MVASISLAINHADCPLLQLDSAETDSLPKREVLKGNPILLPNNLARQEYCYTSVRRETTYPESVVARPGIGKDQYGSLKCH
jgi:hypothetical protein